jgi:hypothetical protein
MSPVDVMLTTVASCSTAMGIIMTLNADPFSWLMFGIGGLLVGVVLTPSSEG